MRCKLQEVELKLYTPDLSAVQSALESAAAALSQPRLYERNIRYENATETFTEQGIVLRLRQDHRARLTYKERGTLENGISRRFEAEVAVDDFEMMDIILRRLGYETALIYEKYRRTYSLGDAEIVLDEMPFGNFTEIEADADMIEALVKQLGLERYSRMNGNYTDIFANVKARLKLDFRDLTFDNFADIEVRPSVFGLGKS